MTMASGVESGSDPGSQDPYVLLGITADAGFEAVQQAKLTALEAAGDNPLARAKVEAAYDAVLMTRLRERQTGRISSAAASASEREQQVATPSGVLSGSSGVLTRLRQLSLPTAQSGGASWMPTLSLSEGQGLLIRSVAGAVGLVLLLAAPGSADLVLSLATIGVFVSQIKRSRRPLASLGWSVLLLAMGLAIGAVVHTLLGTSLGTLLTNDQVQSLPALALLVAGALLLA